MSKLSGKNLLRKHLILFGALVLVAGFAASFYLFSRQPHVSSNTQNCPVANCVALQIDHAQPDTLSVPLGSEVQFNSADGQSHSLSLGKGGEEHSHTGKFSSGTFKSDEAWKVRFDDEGSYFFHDHLNPKINVLVVVYMPGKEYKLPEAH